ncbi:MAG: hypothetical protein JRE23_00140 [Deltaproteobacteria bacterium]|nr:hypothetical protein [Deltaproteobacteria bacterium]
MHKILITGPSGSGKSLILNGLRREYKARGYKAIFIDNYDKGDNLETFIEVELRALPAEAHPEFCVITSNESPEDLDCDFLRVIRTGRS